MALRELQGQQHFSDLPSLCSGTLDFGRPICCVTISHHGYIFGIGCLSGELFACDSRSLGNRRSYRKHSCDVTAIAFSRDTLHIASSDKSGQLRIHSVDDTHREFEHQFDTSIQFVQFSPCLESSKFLLVLLESADLFLVSLDRQPARFGRPMTCVQWSHLTPTFFGSFGRTVFQISVPDFSVQHSFSFEDSKVKTIVSLALAHKDHLFVILDSVGVCRCFVVADHIPEFCGHYIDAINRIRFVHAMFSPDDHYVLLASKGVSPELLRAYAVDTGQLVKTFVGPREPIFQLLHHPQECVIYARTRTELFVWKISVKFRMKNSTPEDGLVERNSEYYEPEDLFDVVEEQQRGDSAGFVPLSLDLFDAKPDNFFPDDANFPNQLLKLPFRPEQQQP
jgi:WD40 repeat protein